MIELKITGMTCGHCVKAVTEALSAVPRVSQVVEVDREQGAARVEGDADPQQLVAAVENEGYEASVA